MELTRLGCDKSDGSSGSGSASSSAAQASTKADDGDPCAVLTDKMVRAQFSLPAEVAVAQERSERTFPMCTWSWERPGAKEKHEQAMEEFRAQAAKGTFSAPPIIRTTNSVWLTLGDVAASPEHARGSFEAALASMDQGLGTEEMQFKHQPIEGVGDQAAWSSKLGQLGVVSGERILWVGVKVAEEAADDREPAIALTRTLLGR